VVRWAWRAARLLLTVAVTWAVVRQVGLGVDDIRGLDPSWWRPNMGLAAAASLVLVLGYFMSAGLWGLMVRELGGTAIPPWRAVRIFMTANLARYVPGKVWQIAGLSLLARREGVGPVVATGAAVLGQAVALMGATLVGAGALLSAGEPVRSWGWVALVGLGAVTMVASVPGVANRLAGLWFRLARATVPEELHPGPTFAVRWVVVYVINWTIYAGAFWVLAESFDVNGSFIEVGGAFAAAYVLGYIAVFAPAGIGVRESFLIVFLGPLLGVGPAGALAIVARVWTTLVEVTAALALSAVPLAGAGEGGS